MSFPVGAPTAPAPFWRRLRRGPVPGGSIRLAYLLWWLLLFGLVGSLLYLSGNLETNPPTTREQRWLPALQIAGVIAVMAYLPILLLHSFFRSERERAQLAAMSEAETNGWTTEFQGQINEWYGRVFDKRRYPIPVTLALITFIAAWTFMFFHDGPAIEKLMVDGVGMNGLAEQIATGPPLSYGFLGAYFFAVSFLFRRYMSGDMGPGAFLHVAVRTWLVAILTIVFARLVDVSAVETAESGETAKAVISAAAFTGAFTPSALLNKIRDLAQGVLSIGDDARPEVPLTVLDGINPWKAARLAEEGIDNVQNLAMDQPSRLFVVTREGSLRVLDWMDQAILYNAATDEIRVQLGALGIKRASDVFLALRANELVTPVRGADGTVTYEVEPLVPDAFPGMDATALRYVAVSIVNHPSFENIRQMREQALRTAAGRFPVATQAMSLRESTAATSLLRDGLHPSVLLVERVSTGPAASAVVIDDRLALTTLDVESDGIAFRTAAAPGTVPRLPVAGRLVASDAGTHLGLYRLAEALGSPASVAAADPVIGDVLTKESHISGAHTGAVDGIVEFMDVVSGRGNLRLTNLLRVSIPSASGDAGAPLFNASGELAAVLVAGSPESTVAVPISRIPRLPRERRPRRRTAAVGGGGNGSNTPGD
jgi:hypothetical protein